jgi:hypothetical protein
MEQRVIPAEFDIVACIMLGFRSALTQPTALLSGVARLTQHAGQNRLLVTLTHAAGDQIKTMMAAIRKGLDHIRAIAPQLPKAARWRALIRYIIAQILAARPIQQPPPIVSASLLPTTQSG